MQSLGMVLKWVRGRGRGGIGATVQQAKRGMLNQGLTVFGMCTLIFQTKLLQ